MSLFRDFKGSRLSILVIPDTLNAVQMSQLILYPAKVHGNALSTSFWRCSANEALGHGLPSSESKSIVFANTGICLNQEDECNTFCIEKFWDVTTLLKHLTNNLMFILVPMKSGETSRSGLDMRAVGSQKCVAYRCSELIK